MAQGVDLISDYSAFFGGEIGILMGLKGLDLYHDFESCTQPRGGLAFLSSCDIDPVCQHVAQSWPKNFNGKSNGPMCAFKNILDKVAEPYQSRLKICETILKELRTQLSAKLKLPTVDDSDDMGFKQQFDLANGEAVKNKDVQELFSQAQQMIVQVVDIVSNPGIIDKNHCAPCVIHGTNCKVCMHRADHSAFAHLDDSEMPSVLQCAGTTCLPWCPGGSCMGMFHEACVPMLVFFAFCKHNGSDYFFQECGRFLDLTTIARVMGPAWKLVAALTCPSTGGDAITRVRRYIFAHNLEKQQQLEGVDCYDQILGGYNFRASADIFFCAPDEYLRKDCKL